MKKLLILLLALFVCVSTNAQVKKIVTKQQKAEMLIKKFMNQNLNDFKSYEPIEYSKIDTLKSLFIHTELQTSLMNLANLAMAYYEKSDAELNLGNYQSQREKLIPIAREIINTSKKYREGYPKIGIGWVINHKCRSKNKIGNLKLGTWTFGFDKNIENIIYMSSEFPEGKKDISTDLLLNSNKLINATKDIISTILKYSDELEKIKKDLYL